MILRRTLIVFLTTLCSAAACAQGYIHYLFHADTAMRQGRYADAARLFALAIAGGGSQQSEFYFAAGEAFAMAGNTDSAFDYLDSAIDKGWLDSEILQKDSSLTALRSDSRWESHITAWKERMERVERSIDKPLQTELLRMADEDQEARQSLFTPGDTSIIRVDRKHLARLRDIIAKHGWPGRSLVGEKAAHAAWLLVQHADAAPGFQDTCLSMLEGAVLRGEASRADLAYLTDRVLMNSGRMQVYGTQTVWNDSVSSYVPRPIADESSVDRRRSEAGLGPLHEYIEFINRTFAPRKPGK